MGPPRAVPGAGFPRPRAGNAFRLVPRVAVCALCLLLAAPSPGAPAGAGPEAIRALIDDGRFEEALALLPVPQRGDGADPELHFLYALAAIGAARRPGLAEAQSDDLLDRAIAALHAMLSDDPGLARVRLELARAFFLKGEDRLARGHFEQVLAGNPPPLVAANIGRFLDAIRARRRWSFGLGAALAPDSNIGRSTDERTIFFFDRQVPVHGLEPPSSGIGLALWGGAEYQAPLEPGWRLRAGADAARREYRGSRFDWLLVAGHLGPRWLANRRTEASLLASARQSWLGNAPSHRDLGARLELGFRASRRVTAFLAASWHMRRYRSRGDLDGPVTDAALHASWAVAPTLRASFSGGYGRQMPRAERWRRTSRRLGAGLSASLPLGFSLGGRAELIWTRFRGDWWPNTRDGSPRRDRTLALSASAHNRAVTVLGFSPELALVREAQTSNAQLHGYRRLGGELRFVRQF